MSVRLLRFLWLVLFLCPLADAQQAAHEEEMRFVEAMRKQGYPDLALQYLEGLKKRPGLAPEVVAELPVEIARTQLEMASDESDTGKKMTIYGDVRSALQKFLKDNPKSPRASEVELDIANVAVLQGRAALSQAIMLDENDERESPERLKARTLLVEAGKELTSLSKKIQDQIKNAPEPKTPAEKVERARLEQTGLQARLDVALNIMDQARTFPSNHPQTAVKNKRNDRILACQKELEQFGGLDANNPIKWRAMAWLGRCQHELGDPTKARQAFATVIDIAARNQAAAEGARLAKYFRLLVINEKAETGEDRSLLLRDGTASWLLQYPRMINTPEGCGVRYLQALNAIERAGNSKDARQKANLLVSARRILAGIENTENEFTDRARRKKIQLLGELGIFKKPVAELTSFEDCYVRSQYEQYEMEKDAETLKDSQLEEKRKERLATITESLTKALAHPDAKKKEFLNEANNARSMLCYYYLGAKKLPECIALGEKFAREDPRSSQAMRCAAYVMQAYSLRVAALANDPEGDEERKKMADFAVYCKDRWKKDLPGDLARHQLAILYLRDRQPEKAIAELDTVTPGYPAYAATQLMLFEQYRNIVATEPNRTDEIRPRMIAVLERVPATAKGEPGANYMYYLARCNLADQYYNVKQYDKMQPILTALGKDLAQTEFNDDKGEDEKIRGYFADRLFMSDAYSRYGRASQALQKNDFAAIAGLLDPVIDSVNEKKEESPLKANPSLANAIFNLDMRANIQIDKLDRTRLAVQAFQALAEDTGADVPPILRQLVGMIRGQIDDLNEKGNAEAKGRAVLGFQAILDDLTKQQKSVNTEFQIVLARCYSSMELYEKAAELLQKIPAPAAAAAENSREVQLYRAAQIQIVKAYREAAVQAADKVAKQKHLAAAQKHMDTVMGDPKTGWGRKNIDALKELVALNMAQENYNTAFKIAEQVTEAISRRADTDPRMREQFLDLYHNMVVCVVKQGAKQSNAAIKQKAMDNGARLVVDLERRFPDLGGEVSARRYADLVASEPDLKKAYDALKAMK